MASVVNNATWTAQKSSTTTRYMPDATPTLSEREQIKVEFYKTYDVMTGIRIAGTLAGFFTVMVLLVIYKSRCKANRQLKDPRLTAAAEAAVAEAEAEELALAAALEAIARLPPKPPRGPRRSLCVDQVMDRRLSLVAPRFSSVGGGYDSLLTAPPRPFGPGVRGGWPSRRCSSITCSSTASSYLERRGSAVVMPNLPPPPSRPRHRAYDEPWDYYYPIDIQVIQPTPELSPCGSEAGLYGAAAAAAASASYRRQRTTPRTNSVASSVGSNKRAPLASMGSVDPPEPDSRSLGSDSVFLEELARRASVRGIDEPPDTEDEVSGFSTDSSDGIVPSFANGGLMKRFLRLPAKKKQQQQQQQQQRAAPAGERWDGCAGCVPRRRTSSSASAPPAPTQTCMTISAYVDQAPVR